MKKIRQQFNFLSDTLLYSYSQVFFAQNKIFGILLLIITFVDPWIGMGGLLSLLISNALAWVLGFDEEAIRIGSYGFNSLLVGLGLSIYFNPTFTFFVLLVIGAIVTLLITIAVAGFLVKYNLPYLSLPFVFSLWTLMLATRNFEALNISDRGVYILNELFAAGSHWLVDLYEKSNQIAIPNALNVYFKSLGAILFQFNLFSGMVIAFGLLIFSRIAFLLSLITFLWAYTFYALLGADISLLSYNYIGFNYILTGIALGGFYLIPSKSSFGGVLLVVPPLVVLTSSLSSIFGFFQLGVYALPFNLVVLTFLYILKLRIKPGGLEEVAIQYFHPEKNLYYRLSGDLRFKNFRPIPMSLPFFGEWVITQAHNGEITHRGAWKEAWDFEIADEEGDFYRGEGRERQDYYCYDKPVLAPANGEVEEILDNVEDNVIGDSNLKQNWGNSIVIKHGYQLYSQLSHLRFGSIKVRKGDRVRKGDVIANCGNSGRSPVPHLHFQLMSTPYIGSATLNYPLANYLNYSSNGTVFHLYDFPLKNQVIGTVKSNDQLKYAFNFLPGQVLKFKYKVNNGGEGRSEWEVKTDVFNNSYLQCLYTGSQAFFINDGVVFYFTYFKGKRSSLLYDFFVGSYKVVFFFDPKFNIEDVFPLNLITRSWMRYLNDFIAPFQGNLMKAKYTLSKQQANDALAPTEIRWRSKTEVLAMGKKLKVIDFTFLVEDYQIRTIIIQKNQKKIEMEWQD